MKDEDATPRDPAADPEQAEALSRAAREAVRQPADPRLERSFAKLGLFTDDTPTEAGTQPPSASPPSPSTSATATPVAAVVGAAAPAVDLDPLRAQLATLQATTERVDRRLATMTILLIIVALGVAIVALLVLVRP